MRRFCKLEFAVNGYLPSGAQRYDCLTSDTRDIGDFRSCLEHKYLGQTNNTLADFNALFDSY